MAYTSLYNSKIATPRAAPGLIKAIDGELQKLWNAAGYGSFTVSSAELLDGALTVSADVWHYVVTSQAGNADSLTAITGDPVVGREYVIRATTDHTITVVSNSMLRLGGSDFILNSTYDMIRLLCISSEIFIDAGRYSNG